MQKIRFILFLALLQGGILGVGAISLDAWTGCNSPSTAHLLGVTSGGGLFVAVGEQGTILTSADGSNWVKQASGTTMRLRGVTYGDGRFIVVGGNAAPAATRIVLGSPDGTNWSILSSSGDVSFAGVAYAKGTFVAVASAFASDIYSSSNAINWTLRATVSGVMGGVAYGSNLFVAAGNTIQTSPDGIQWIERMTASQSLRGITYGKGKFVAVGDNTPSLFVVSNDGTNWTSSTPVSVGNLKTVSYGNGYFLAGGGGGAMVSSYDGVIWTNRTSGGSSFLRSVAHGTASFVAVADGGAILQSGMTAPFLKNVPTAIPGIHQISITADPGRSYWLEASADLVNWSKIFPFSPTGQVTSVSISKDGFPRRFFRVSTQ